MFHTLTLNPSLDVFLEVVRLVPGRVLRTDEPNVRAGGKGINVARQLCRLARPREVRAHLIAGGHTGERLLALLRSEGIHAPASRHPGETRQSTHVRESSTGREYKLNPAGCPVPPRVLAACIRGFVGALRPGDVAVISGSLPPGAPGTLLERTVRRARRAGATVWVDMEGDALRSALRGRPHGLKPNREEFRGLTGVDPARASRARVVEAARGVLSGSGRAGEMLLSLGRMGALWVARDAVALARPERVARRAQAVGAGDALLASWLAFHAGESDRGKALERAVRHASMNIL